MTKIKLNFICEETRYIITEENREDKMFIIEKSNLKFDGRDFYTKFYNSYSYELYDLSMSNNNSIGSADKIIYNYVKQIIDEINKSFQKVRSNT